jgi:Protein of unknown function (DUF4239)
VLLFLSGLPLWAAILLMVVLPTILAMCGLVIVRRVVGLERLTSNNEIAGFKFATVGVIYAVLVAFAVIVAWEKFSEAQAAVVKEAGASTTVYRLTAGDDPKMMAVREALGNYLRLAIDRDWPQMAVERRSREVTQALDALYAAALRLTGSQSGQTALLVEIFKQIDSITEARRARLHLATGVVPPVIWPVLFAGAVLTVVFTFFFGTENLRAQVLMTGILSALTFTALFTIVQIDHPFSGASFVGNEVLKDVLEEFEHQGDRSTSGLPGKP